MFGLGFAHAQDRLWQLETHRRIAAGRLAEAFGPAALDADRFLRALGVRRAAAAQWAKASGASRAAVEAYAAGINAYLKQSLHARPPEFVLLGLEPEAWEPADSFAWAIMMAWDLGGNWSSELLRMRLAARLPVERINELLPPYAGEKPLADGRLRGAAARMAGRRRPRRPHAGAARTGGARIGHRRRRLEQLGRRRLAHRERQAAARQRPAPEALGAGAVVLRAARGARLQGRRRDPAGTAAGRARAERAHRLGLHQHRARCTGPVPRAHQAGRPDAATRRPMASRASRARPRRSTSRAAPTCRSRCGAPATAR